MWKNENILKEYIMILVTHTVIPHDSSVHISSGYPVLPAVSLRFVLRNREITWKNQFNFSTNFNCVEGLAEMNARGMR